MENVLPRYYRAKRRLLASPVPFPYNPPLARSRRFCPVGSRPLFLLGHLVLEVWVGPNAIEERVKAIADKVAIDQGLELVHAEVAGPENKPIVRVFIDKPAERPHQDCSEVSLQLGTVLDC